MRGEMSNSANRSGMSPPRARHRMRSRDRISGLTEPLSADHRPRRRERSVRPLVLLEVGGSGGDHDGEEVRRRHEEEGTPDAVAERALRYHAGIVTRLVESVEVPVQIVHERTDFWGGGFGISYIGRMGM